MTMNDKEKLTSTQSARHEEKIEAANNGERVPTSYQVSNKIIALENTRIKQTKGGYTIQNKRNISLGKRGQKEYAVVKIYMVAQTNNYLQFHTDRISQILEKTITVRYLTTNYSDNTPIDPQVKLLNQIGRGVKRRRYMRHTILVSGKIKHHYKAMDRMPIFAIQMKEKTRKRRTICALRLRNITL